MGEVAKKVFSIVILYFQVQKMDFSIIKLNDLILILKYPTIRQFRDRTCVCVFNVYCSHYKMTSELESF